VVWGVRLWSWDLGWDVVSRVQLPEPSLMGSSYLLVAQTNPTLSILSLNKGIGLENIRPWNDRNQAHTSPSLWVTRVQAESLLMLHPFLRLSRPLSAPLLNSCPVMEIQVTG